MTTTTLDPDPRAPDQLVPTESVLGMLQRLQNERATNTTIAVFLGGYAGPCEQEARSLARRLIAHDLKSRRLIDLGLDLLIEVKNPLLSKGQVALRYAERHWETMTLERDSDSIAREIGAWHRSVAPEQFAETE